MKLLKKIFIGFVIFTVAFLLFYRLWFLRAPHRTIPPHENSFISPANGEVVSVTKFTRDWVAVNKEKFGVVHLWTTDVDSEGYIISIQMNPSHVHYQRMPVDGKIVAHTYTPGNFNNAILMSNDLGIRYENEHNEILVENTEGTRFKLVQISGFLARRIVDFVQPGQERKAGELIGLIKFGSQVTVILPAAYLPLVQKGQTVVDGETILAKKKD